MAEREVKIFARFERFWHWTQAALIVALLLTGFAITGLNPLIPFGPAVILHTAAAIALIVLWVFAIFWHLTTGSWVHYLPTTSGLGRVVRFYAWGIFQGEAHPYRKAYWRKHNPLQALSYLALKLLLFPAVWLSGLALLGYNFWQTAPSAAWWQVLLADLHLLAAAVIAAFVVVHVYLLTVGGSFLAHLRPMITGFDKVTLTPEEEAYLRADEPARIR